MSFIDPQLQGDDTRPQQQPKTSEQAWNPAIAPHYPDQSGYSTTSPQQQTAPSPLVDGEEQYQQSPGNDDAKRPRACESCRGLKVRCDQDPNHPDAPCRRCAKAGRQCIYTQPSRKRQKKADSRVADLERKLDALTSALHAQQYAGGPSMYPPPSQASPGARTQPPAQPQRYPEPPSNVLYEPDSAARLVAGLQQSYQPQDAQLDQFSNKRRRTDDGSIDPSRDLARLVKDYNKDPWDTLEKEQSDRLAKNGIRRELYPVAPELIIKMICDVLDGPTRTRIFDRFLDDCLPTLPALAFAPGTKAQDVLETKPILFLVIMAGAGWGHIPQDAQYRLAQEILDIFADCVLRHAIKSLELVQAMLVAVLWYRPPEKPEQVNFYLIVHMAACMALDIGLGKRFSQAKSRRGFGGPAQDLPPGRLTAMVDSDSLEARRTWLACYYMCAAFSMSLRRPNLIRWTKYMQECIEFLETCPDAAPTDRIFVDYVRLQRIGEEISISFQMDDPSATAISISDPKVSYTLDVFEQKLQDWYQKLPEESRQKSHLMFLHEVAILYLHEIAMHVNHNVDDFKLPFTEESLRAGTEYSEVLTQRQMASLEKCLKAAQKIIATYTGFGFEAAGNMPTLLFFIRCAYALVVLIKMHMAVVTPGSEVAKIIKPADVRAEEHMDMLWGLFQRMARFDRNRPHSKALKILSILRGWFHKHQEEEGAAKASASTAGGHERPAPFGRNPHGVGATGSSKLQVLSEAATAGQRDHTNTTHGRDLSSPANQNWTADSPTVFNMRHDANPVDSQSTVSGVTAETPSSNTAATSQQMSTSKSMDQFTKLDGSAGTMPQGGHAAFGQGFTKFFSPSGSDNLDWTAGMDLDQVLEGAFRDIDASGDLGGWFFGDGVGAYQIPGDNGAVGNAGGA